MDYVIVAIAVNPLLLIIDTILIGASDMLKENSSGKSIAVAALLALAGIIADIAFVIHGNKSAVNAILVIGLVVAVIAIIALITNTQANTKIQDEKKHLEMASAFYKKCKENGIRSIPTDNLSSKILLIAKNYGLTDKIAITQSFEIGKQQFMEEVQREKLAKQQEKKAELTKARQAEIKHYYEEKEKTGIVGKSKYTQEALQEIRELKSQYAELEKVDTNSLYLQHKKDNWGWAGGFANAIAGPAAGLMVAQTEHEKNVAYNEAVDEHNANLIRAGLTPEKMRLMQKLQLGELIGKRKALEKTVNEISNKLIDDENAEAKCSLISFKITSTVNKPSGYLTLRVKVSTPPLKLLGHPASLDGSVRIIVKNENEQEVGEAYYNGTGFNQTDLSRVGFNDTFGRNVIAIPTAIPNFSKAERYTFEAKPVSLWLIEQ